MRGGYKTRHRDGRGSDNRFVVESVDHRKDCHRSVSGVLDTRDDLVSGSCVLRLYFTPEPLGS